MNITIRQMEIFAQIAKSSSVSLAAKDLMISQAAASIALAELEKQLGSQLFDRNGKSLIINSAGKKLLPKISEILSKVDELAVILSQGSLSGDLKIGASSTIGNYLMPSVLGAFAEMYPDVKLSLVVGNTENIISDLLGFKIDFGFIEGLCRNSAIEVKSWKADKLVVFASPRHDLAGKKEITMSDIASARWVLRETGSGTRTIFENAIAGKINNLDISFELGHSEAIKLAVKNNLGISCLSYLTVAESLSEGSLVELPTPFLDLRRNLYQVTRKGQYMTPAAQAFYAFTDYDAGKSK